MAQINLVAETGRSTGSGASKRLRAAGKIPGVVYGHGMTPVAVAVDHRELRHALSGPAGVNAVVNLTVDGKAQPTVVKSLQRDPIRRVVSHVDFLVVRLDEEITVEVPIVLEGEAKAVLNEGGIVEQMMQTLTVVTTPAAIPSELRLDISALTPGDALRVADIALPAGAVADADPEAMVVLASTSRAAIEAEGEGEAEGETPAESDADAE